MSKQSFVGPTSAVLFMHIACNIFYGFSNANESNYSVGTVSHTDDREWVARVISYRLKYNNNYHCNAIILFEACSDRDIFLSLLNESEIPYKKIWHPEWFMLISNEFGTTFLEIIENCRRIIWIWNQIMIEVVSSSEFYKYNQGITCSWSSLLLDSLLFSSGDELKSTFSKCWESSPADCWSSIVKLSQFTLVFSVPLDLHRNFFSY